MIIKRQHEREQPPIGLAKPRLVVADRASDEKPDHDAVPPHIIRGAANSFQPCFVLIGRRYFNRVPGCSSDSRRAARADNRGQRVVPRQLAPRRQLRGRGKMLGRFAPAANRINQARSAMMMNDTGSSNSDQRNRYSRDDDRAVGSSDRTKPGTVALLEAVDLACRRSRLLE